jgi:hypothetical protein
MHHVSLSRRDHLGALAAGLGALRAPLDVLLYIGLIRAALPGERQRELVRGHCHWQLLRGRGCGPSVKYSTRRCLDGARLMLVHGGRGRHH